MSKQESVFKARWYQANQSGVQMVRNTSKIRPRDQAPTKKALAGVSCPSGLDILSGRGGRTNLHAGNVMFRDEARKLRDVYEKGSPVEKLGISRDLVKRVKAYGCRFLAKGDDGLWYEMTDDGARKKASH
ncbi:hypothetical protein ACHAXR_000508, partial [Thalassiosira sp. AJA248-18]